MTKKQHDMRGNEIDDPYNVIVSRMVFKMEEMKRYIGSLKDPEKLLEAYVIGRNLSTLVGTLLEIYEPSLKKVDLPGGLDQIKKANERYRNTLVKRLSENQENNDREMLAILERRKNESSKMLMNAFSNFTKRK